MIAYGKLCIPSTRKDRIVWVGCCNCVRKKYVLWTQHVIIVSGVFVNCYGNSGATNVVGIWIGSLLRRPVLPGSSYQGLFVSVRLEEKGIPLTSRLHYA